MLGNINLIFAKEPEILKEMKEDLDKGYCIYFGLYNCANKEMYWTYKFNDQYYLLNENERTNKITQLEDITKKIKYLASDILLFALHGVPSLQNMMNCLYNFSTPAIYDMISELTGLKGKSEEELIKEREELIKEKEQLIKEKKALQRMIKEE